MSVARTGRRRAAWCASGAAAAEPRVPASLERRLVEVDALKHSWSCRAPRLGVPGAREVPAAAGDLVEGHPVAAVVARRVAEGHLTPGEGRSATISAISRTR